MRGGHPEAISWLVIAPAPRILSRARAWSADFLFHDKRGPEPTIKGVLVHAFTGAKASASGGTEQRRELGPPCDAFEAFHCEFDYLFRTMQRLGVRESDVEDLVHEVFLVLSRKWQEYDPRRPLRPYLFGIAFRVAARHRRRQAREIPGEVPEIVDAQAAPDQVLSAAEARILVLHALEYIALPRRAVFVMHDLDETPMRVIADTLRIPLFTAYSRLRKARKEFERAVNELQEGSR
jgi:RNA polymerase sigma-70 factor (ECF subfamily)